MKLMYGEVTNSEDRGESIQHKNPTKETTYRAVRDGNQVNYMGMTNSEDNGDKHIWHKCPTKQRRPQIEMIMR